MHMYVLYIYTHIIYVYIIYAYKYTLKRAHELERLQGHNGGRGGEERGIHENYVNAILLYEIVKNKINVN